MVDRAVLRLGNDKDLTITVRHNSPENKYVQQVLLNGRELDGPFFSHQDIADGAELEFVMGDRPVK